MISGFSAKSLALSYASAQITEKTLFWIPLIFKVDFRLSWQAFSFYPELLSQVTERFVFSGNRRFFFLHLIISRISVLFFSENLRTRKKEKGNYRGLVIPKGTPQISASTFALWPNGKIMDQKLWVRQSLCKKKKKKNFCRPNSFVSNFMFKIMLQKKQQNSLITSFLIKLSNIVQICIFIFYRTPSLSNFFNLSFIVRNRSIGIKNFISMFVWFSNSINNITKFFWLPYKNVLIYFIT